MELSALSLQVRGLSVLRGLQQHPLVHAYLDVFDELGQNADAFADRYGALCAAQFACRDASRAILDAVNPPEHFPQDGENYPASEDETPHQTM